MSSMVLMIFPISPDLLLISLTAFTSSCICVLLSATRWSISTERPLTSSVRLALESTWVNISLMVAASSSTELACLAFPSARLLALSATWPELAVTCSAVRRMLPRVSFSVVRIRIRASLIFAKSPSY